MQTDWVKIYASTDLYRTELLKQFLIENAIEAVLLDKTGFPYFIGEVELYIHQKDLEQAKEIIERTEN